MSTPESLQIDLEDEFSALTEVYDAADRWLDMPSRYPAAPAVSAWTPAQHLYHLARTNASMLKAALLLARGEADAKAPALKPAGRRILQTGTIPRGVADAPDFVRPPESCDDETLRETVDRSRQKFDAVLKCGDALAGAEGGLTHPLWGTLTAPQWVRAARIHAQHHLQIADDIAAEQGRTAP